MAPTSPSLIKKKQEAKPNKVIAKLMHGI
jgi:hypothetical protein